MPVFLAGRGPRGVTGTHAHHLAVPVHDELLAEYDPDDEELALFDHVDE